MKKKLCFVFALLTAVPVTLLGQETSQARPLHPPIR